MFQSIRVFLISMLAISFSFSDLFISEYAEGSSNNKYLEIFNSGSDAVSLDDYAFAATANGSDGTHEYWNTFTEGATLAVIFFAVDMLSPSSTNALSGPLANLSEWWPYAYNLIGEIDTKYLFFVLI